MGEKIRKAIEVFRKGGIVIFPTDTVFGVGCRIDDEEAIEKFFLIKRKPKKSPVPILVDSTEMAQKYLKPVSSEVIDKLMKPYWPGGLTIVLPCVLEKVQKRLIGSGGTLGVRVPDHGTILKVIKSIGVPIIASSANFYGDKTPYRFFDIDKKFIALVDFALDGRCTKKIPSTVIDCSKKPWKILREGAVKIQDPELEIQNPNRNIILSIDTSSNKNIIVGLKLNEQEHLLKQRVGLQKAQVALPMISKILKKYSIDLKEINEIKVNTGPGSFTGLRVGISIANVLGAFLKIPINGKKIRELVEPVYK